MKNIEYQEYIAEVGDVLKTKRLVTGIVAPVMSYNTLCIPGKCETQEIHINHEPSETIIKYIKHVGGDTAFLIIKYEFVNSPKNNDLLQIGMLAEIKGLLEEQDKTRTILISPIKIVRYKKFDTQNSEIISKDADIISIFENSEIFLAETEELKYHISDIKKLKELVRQGITNALYRPYGHLYVGKQERMMNLGLEYIVRISELLTLSIRTSTSNDELVAIVYNPNLNQRFGEIISRMKRDIEAVRCKTENIREVSEIPKGYHLILNTWKDNIRMLCVKHYSSNIYLSVSYKQDTSLLLALEQYQQEGPHVICTATSCQDLEKNKSQAVLGKISHIKRDGDYTYCL